MSDLVKRPLSSRYNPMGIAESNVPTDVMQDIENASARRRAFERQGQLAQLRDEDPRDALQRGTRTV